MRLMVIIYSDRYVAMNCNLLKLQLAHFQINEPTFSDNKPHCKNFDDRCQCFVFGPCHFTVHVYPITSSPDLTACDFFFYRSALNQKCLRPIRLELSKSSYNNTFGTILKLYPFMCCERSCKTFSFDYNNANISMEII